MKLAIFAALLLLNRHVTRADEGQTATSKAGMVASTEAHASRVGAQILSQGGNAVDAAVAVGFALAVTHPAAGNIGGGGFMVIRLDNGMSTTIDYRERAPSRASRNMYVDSTGKLLPGGALTGPTASGVPGSVAGLELAHGKFGRLPWKILLEPACKLAEDGFVVSDGFAKSLKAKLLSKNPESRRIFQRNGNYYQAGETFRQPELAATLRRIQQSGSTGFYSGETANMLVQEMERTKGIISLSDLQNYKAIERQPLKSTYRGLEVIAMPPPSSGGAVLIEMLNMLSPYPIGKMAVNSPQRVHLLAEVMRRAFADRAEYFGDPDFVSVPVSILNEKWYAKERRSNISLSKATPSVHIYPGIPTPKESHQTTHYSVVDGAGSAVSTTTTLNMGFGSGITVKGAGFLLNNEMDDFAAQPGKPNGFGLIQGEKNAVAAGKRPLSSMTPTILVKDGRVVLVVGSPGGPTIINTVLQIILNTVDKRIPLADASAAGRIHHQWMPDEISVEKSLLSNTAAMKLKTMGHKIKSVESIGDVQAISIDDRGTRTGVTDPRSTDGLAAGTDVRPPK